MKDHVISFVIRFLIIGFETSGKIGKIPVNNIVSYVAKKELGASRKKACFQFGIKDP